MKKIFNILLCCVAVAFVASCSDDNDNPYAHTSSVKVTKSEVFFEAVASDGGVIEYDANGDVSVTSSADWCKAQMVTLPQCLSYRRVSHSEYLQRR